MKSYAFNGLTKPYFQFTDDVLNTLPEDSQARIVWRDIRCKDVGYNIYKAEKHGAIVYESNIIYLAPDVWKSAPDDLRESVNFLLDNGFELGNPVKTFVYWMPYVPVLGFLLTLLPTNKRRYFCTYLDFKHSFIVGLLNGIYPALWLILR